MDVNKKREKEKQLLQIMIQIYCRGNHGKKKQLCDECKELLEYAQIRTQNCPFMETKTFCSACKVHCYAPEKRRKIQVIMRYAGPRMLFSHPILAVRHMIITLKEKRRRSI